MAPPGPEGPVAAYANKVCTYNDNFVCIYLALFWRASWKWTNKLITLFAYRASLSGQEGPLPLLHSSQIPPISSLAWQLQ